MSELQTTEGTRGYAPKGFKLMLKFMSALNVVLYRLSGGKIMGSLGGGPVCLVTMTGAKSGRRLTRPLIHIANGADILLIASQGGAPKSPAWYHNLRAHPDIEIQVGSTKRKMRARQASDEEKANLWPIAVATYKDFDLYKSRTDRNIPLMICSPI